MTREHPMMECGHAANAVDTKTGAPVCVICVGIHPGAKKVHANPPDLTGRRSRCSYYGRKCTSERDSSTGLPFFEHRPGKPFDAHYCGCFGWD